MTQGTQGVPADGGQGASPPAPPPPPAPGNEGGGGNEPAPFHARFEDPEERGYAETKGWKSERDMLQSYRNLEKLRGVPKERLLELPANMEDSDALKPVLEKIGYAAPASAEEYGFSTIEGVDPAEAKVLSEIAFKHGVPAKLAKPIMEEIVAMNAQARADAMKQIEEEVAVETGRLKAKIGADKWDEFIETGRRAARQYGVSQQELEAMETSLGAARMMEVWNAIGKASTEGGFVTGERKQTYGMSPEAAASERAALMQDKAFMARYVAGDRDARAKMDRVNQIIASGKMAP